MKSKNLVVTLAIVIALLVGWIGGGSLAQTASASQAYASQTQIIALQKQISALQVRVRDTDNNMSSWSSLLSHEINDLSSYAHGLPAQMSLGNIDNEIAAAQYAIKCIETADLNSYAPYAACGY